MTIEISQIFDFWLGVTIGGSIFGVLGYIFDIEPLFLSGLIVAIFGGAMTLVAAFVWFAYHVRVIP